MLSDEIETLEFENKVFGLVALMTNINFRMLILGHETFFTKSLFF